MIFVRREDKNRWERRAPLTPAHVSRLVREHGVEVVVEPSAIRAFPDAEYAAAGARLSSDPGAGPVVVGVKEVPVDKIVARAVYVFFSHVTKGQRHNMPMLRRLMDLGCTLIDFEKVTDEKGRRLILFGRHAGLAGAVDTLWALGRRLAWRGLDTPFATIRQAVAYEGLEAAREAVAAAGRAVREVGLPEEICPLVVGVTGYGNTSRGACEVLDLLPIRDIDPSEVADVARRFSRERRLVFRAVFHEEHTVAAKDPRSRFDLEHFRAHPGDYRSVFGAVWPRLTVLVNCVYWEPGFPRLVAREDLRARYAVPPPPRLEVIGDVSCDLEGAIECNVRITTPDSPTYVFDPLDDGILPGVEGRGPVVLAVDNLPCEFPKDASRDFGDAFTPFVQALAECSWEGPPGTLALPPELLRAVVVQRGELAPGYAYLRDRISA